MANEIPKEIRNFAVIGRVPPFHFRVLVRCRRVDVAVLLVHARIHSPESSDG